MKNTISRFEESPLYKTTKTKGVIGLALILWGWAIHSSDSIIGASIANSASIYIIIAGTILGGLLIVLNLFLGGYIGHKTGFPVNVSSKLVFGARGYLIPNILTIITLTGWAGYSIGLTSEFFLKVFNISDQYSLFARISFALLFGLFAGIGTAFLGTRFIEIVSVISSPIICVLFVYMALKLVVSAGGWYLISATPTVNIGWDIARTGNSFLNIVGLTFTSWITIGLYSSDYFRFAKKWSHILLAGGFAFIFGKVLVQILGAISARALGTSDIFEVFTLAGAITIGFIAYMFDNWTSADAQIYSSGISLTNIFKINRVISSVIITCVAILVALLGIYNALLGFLLFIGILVGPILGPIYSDYYVINKFIKSKDYDRPERWDSLVKFNINGIISWIFGVVIAYLSRNQGLMGLNGIFASFVLYTMLEIVGIKLNLVKSK